MTENSETNNIQKVGLDQAHMDFISTVSHELRTPLTSIRGFADTLLSSFDRLTPEQRVKFLTIIREQSNRLICLVENLLAVSKLQSEKEMFVFKSVNVISLVENCVQLMQAQYKTHNFNIKGKKNLPKILIDTDKFQQVMLNLLDNAAKYSLENSTVNVEFKINLEKNILSLSITDEGIGISENNLDRIFDRFSRIDSPLTRKVQGSGLGLFITKNLVEKMNGKIFVQSSNSGSIFTIQFPLDSIDGAGKEKIGRRENVG